MKFRAHETFHIRKGWLYKGLKNVREDEYIFLDKGERRASEKLGIGTNMVKALRYWMQATGLTQESTKGGSRPQSFTKFGEVVFHNDKYFEEEGTWWFIHYRLATNKDLATSWYWFFNEFNIREFSKDDFVEGLNTYVKYNDEQTADVSISSLQGDYACLINTYLPKNKLNKDKITAEDNIDCPLTQLGLLGMHDKKSMYKVPLKRDAINPLIIMAVLAEQYCSNHISEVKISRLLNESLGIGYIFNMDLNILNNYLDKLQEMNFIKVVRTAGLDVVKFSEEYNAAEILSRYYNDINKVN